MKKSQLARKKNLAYESINPDIKYKLMSLHEKIEDILEKNLLTFNFRLKKYIPYLEKNGIVDDSIINEIISVVEKYLRPERNENISNACQNAYLPDNKYITPCGLICELQFPCYECDFKFSSFSKRFKRATKSQIEESFNEILEDEFEV